jgi:hypothetical protein
MNLLRYWLFGMGSGSSSGCGPMAAVSAAAGVSSAAKIPPVEETLERLEGRKNTCMSAIEVIEKRIVAKGQFLLKHGKDPVKKTVCMQALREKRQLEKDLEAKNGTLEKLTAAIATLNRNLDHADTVDALQEANQAMKAMAADPALQNADEIMVELEQHVDNQADIDMIISAPLKGSAAVDELDLEKELAALGDAVVDQETSSSSAKKLSSTPPAQLHMTSPTTAAALYSNGATIPQAKASAKQAPSTQRDRMKELENAVSV